MVESLYIAIICTRGGLASLQGLLAKDGGPGQHAKSPIF